MINYDVLNKNITYVIMTIENRKLRYYFVPPPLIGTYYKYQDVNNDEKLRKKVTTTFKKNF